MADRELFLYDLRVPLAWPVAEWVARERPRAEWQPAAGDALAGGAPAAPPWDGDRAAIEQLAAALGLPAMRWPARLPATTRRPLLAAAFAKSVGRGVAFTLAFLRHVYNAGRDPDAEETLLLAAAACELHPRAVLSAVGTATATAALDAGADAARAAGVTELPALVAGHPTTAGRALLDRIATELVAAQVHTDAADIRVR